jgi:hypothetical protein
MDPSGPAGDGRAARDPVALTSVRAVRALARWAAPALLAAHCFSFPFQDLPLVTDVRHYVYFAKLTTAGGMLYRDVFEVKTPLSTLAGAFLFDAGERLGVDGVTAIRVGYLALAVAAGVLAFQVQRLLSGGSALLAHLALAPYLGLWLLAGLPSVGNVPKLLMAACASAAALCLYRRAYVLAGLAAGAAWLDWQIGGLVALGVAAGLLAMPRAERGRATGRALAGVLLAIAPVLAWLWAQGALEEAVRQTVLASALRGAATWQARGVAEELARRAELLRAACGREWWLLLVAGAGLWLGARRLREVDPAAGRPLAVYHYGVVIFSAVELQGLGDVFALLHSLAFFAGLALVELPWRTTRAGRTWRRPVAVLAAAVWLAAVRPWAARSEWGPPPSVPRTAATLGAQRRLAENLDRDLGDRKVLILGPSDQRVLAERLHAGRLVVWTPATQRYYRRGGEESADTLARLLLEEGAQVVICDRGYDLERATAGRFRRLADRAVDGHGVTLFTPHDAAALPALERRATR